MLSTMTIQTEAQTDDATDPATDDMIDAAASSSATDATDAARATTDATSTAPASSGAEKAAGSRPASAAKADGVQNMSVLARALLVQLRQRFPAFGQCLPLAIGIDKLLLAEMPDLSRKTLRVALNMHTHSSRYLKAVATATARVDLAGNPAGDVVEEHRTRAAEMLKERFKKEREQRNATQAAENAKRQAEQAQQRLELEAQARADKLNQLAAKFSGKTGH